MVTDRTGVNTVRLPSLDLFRITGGYEESDLEKKLLFILSITLFCVSVNWENLTFRQLPRKKKVLLNSTVALFIALGSSECATQFRSVDGIVSENIALYKEYCQLR